MVDGETPLQRAIFKGDMRMARLLLSYDAWPGRNIQGEDLSDLYPGDLYNWTFGVDLFPAGLLSSAGRLSHMCGVEWRRHKHARFPRAARAGLRTLMILRKAQRESDYRYPQAGLCALPEELMQYMFVLVCGTLLDLCTWDRVR